jgi:hypothetical protein
MNGTAESLHDPLPLLRACVAAMRMVRELPELRLEQQTVRPVWLDALSRAQAAIAYHDERAKDVLIDLDAANWRSIKEAIQKSPRFQEMYEAGGTFTDACASVAMWLQEHEPECSLSVGS